MLDPAALTLLDNIANALVLADERVRYGLAQTSTELEAVFRLRYQTVIAQGWASPEDYPDGLERDEYDDTAIHVVGWQGDDLAATMRLVLPSPTRPLPTEAAFNIRIEPYQQVVDCSRSIVAPAYRERDTTYFFGVLGRFWQEIRQYGYEEMGGALTEWMISYYERAGFPIQIVGEAQEYWGEKRYPVKFDLPRIVARLRG